MGRSQVSYNRTHGRGRGRSGRGGGGRGSSRGKKQQAQPPPPPPQPQPSSSSELPGSHETAQEDVILDDAYDYYSANLTATSQYVLSNSHEIASDHQLQGSSLLASSLFGSSSNDPQHYHQHDRQKLVHQMAQAIEGLSLSELYRIPSCLTATLTVGDSSTSGPLEEETETDNDQAVKKNYFTDHFAQKSLESSTATAQLQPFSSSPIVAATTATRPPMHPHSMSPQRAAAGQPDNIIVLDDEEEEEIRAATISGLDQQSATLESTSFGNSDNSQNFYGDVDADAATVPVQHLAAVNEDTDLLPDTEEDDDDDDFISKDPILQRRRRTRPSQNQYNNPISPSSSTEMSETHDKSDPSSLSNMASTTTSPESFNAKEEPALQEPMAVDSQRIAGTDDEDEESMDRWLDEALKTTSTLSEESASRNARQVDEKEDEEVNEAWLDSVI